VSSDLERQCAGLLVVGFDGLSPTTEVERLIDRGVAGIVLFSRNVEAAQQVAELTGALKRRAGRRLLLSVDQEGGRVMRLRERHGFTELPPLRTLGAAGDPELAYQVGALLGRELRAVGIDQDYAPVVDVDTNPANPVIGNRSFSPDPESCGRLGAALALGIQSEGVAACAKHFPGHGDTSQDSHLQLPRLTHGLERLRVVELPPFRELARAGAAAVMTAHVVFAALDPDRPATMSARAMQLLRVECGFSGAVISDDMEMEAVAGHYALDEAAVEAVRAGVDLLLVCHRPDRQHLIVEGLCRAVVRGDLSRDRIAEARGRVEHLLDWAGPPPDPEKVVDRLRTAQHLALVARVPALPVGRDPTAAA